MSDVSHRLIVRGFIDPRWLRQVQHGQHNASVAEDGTVTLQGVRLYFENNTPPYPPGTSIVVWSSRWFYCRSLAENEVTKQEAAARQAAAEERYRDSLNANRQEAEAFNARVQLPVPWTTGIKDVLSGLSENSAGTGSYARTVIHILLKASLSSGRLTRNPGDFLCSSNQGMNGKRWSAQPQETWYDGDNKPYLPKVTCKQCLRLAERWIRPDPAMQPEQPNADNNTDAPADRYFEPEEYVDNGYDR